MRMKNSGKKLTVLLVIASLLSLTYLSIADAKIFAAKKSSVETIKVFDELDHLTIGDVKQIFEKYVNEIEKTGVSTKEVRSRLTRAFNALYASGITDDMTLKKLVSLVEAGVLGLPTLLQLNILCKITSFCLVGIEFDITLFTTGMVWFGAGLTKSYDSQVPIIPDQISVSMIGLVIGFTGDFEIYWSFPLGAIELKGWHMQGDTILIFAI
jgi:hypothetical protein